MTKRISSIAYIEDTKKHHKLLGELASESTKKAVRLSKKSNISITYLDGNNVVKESPNGKKKFLLKFGFKRRKVKVGEKSTINY